MAILRELNSRTPPEADLLRRIIALEAETTGHKGRLNSIQSKVYREATKKRADDTILGMLGAPPTFLGQDQMQSEGVSDDD